MNAADVKIYGFADKDRGYYFKNNIIIYKNHIISLYYPENPFLKPEKVVEVLFFMISVRVNPVELLFKKDFSTNYTNYKKTMKRKQLISFKLAG